MSDKFQNIGLIDNNVAKTEVKIIDFQFFTGLCLYKVSGIYSYQMKYDVELVK